MDLEPALTHGIIFSDTVIREHGTGKLSFIGSFQYFNAPSVPFTSPQFIVTVLLTNLRGKVELKVSVRIEEVGSGHVVASSTSEVTSKTEVSQKEVVEIPFGIPPALFPNAGIYKAVILVNNEAVGSRELVVRTITALPPKEV